MKTREKGLPTYYNNKISDVQNSQNNTIHNSSLALINNTSISNSVYNKLNKRSNSNCLELLNHRQSISKTNFDISTILGN